MEEQLFKPENYVVTGTFWKKNRLCIPFIEYVIQFLNYVLHIQRLKFWY